MAHLTTKQIKQLLEIDHAGSGIRSEVQALITRLTSGGIGSKSDDPRVAQAKRLWDKGFGAALDIDSFESYLSTIFEIPEELKAHDERFPHLVLVDARLGLTRSCQLAGLEYAGDDETFEDFDPKQGKPMGRAYWMRCQDGRKNRKKSIKTCRENFTADEHGLTAMEGVALYVQHPEVIKSHYLDLPGSVYRGLRNAASGLGYWNGDLKLCWGGEASPRCGSASRSAPREE